VVVVVRSIAPAAPRAYATQLFNRWRIGDATRNDGVLLFAALDDRAAEIVLGSGVDGDEQVAASEDVMQEVMVPRFRAGRPGTFSTAYDRCRKCRHITKASTTTTLQAATETSGGVVRVDQECAHCGHRSSFTRPTPRLSGSSSSSESYFSSDSSSGSSSSSSSGAARADAGR